MNDTSKPTNVQELVAYLAEKPFLHCGSYHAEDAGPRKFTGASPKMITFDKLAPNEGKATLPIGPCRPCPEGPDFSFDEDGFTVHIGSVGIRYAYLETADEVPLVRYAVDLKLGTVLGGVNFACAHLFDETNFSDTFTWVGGTHGTLWDEWAKGTRFLAVYPVRGGSEGHYVHIDLLSGVGEFRHEEEGPLLGQPKHKGLLGKPVGMCKTFKGMAHAQKIANTAQLALRWLI